MKINIQNLFFSFSKSPNRFQILPKKSKHLNFPKTIISPETNARFKKNKKIQTFSISDVGGQGIEGMEGETHTNWTLVRDSNWQKEV